MFGPGTREVMVLLSEMGRSILNFFLISSLEEKQIWENHESCLGHERPNGRGELEQAVRGLGWGCKQVHRQHEAGV